MNRQKKLLQLELKTGLAQLVRAFITMAAMILIAALLLCLYIGLRTTSEQKMVVGIYSEDQSDLYQMMMQFAGSVPALSALCSLDSCDYQDGMEALSSGEYQMLVCIPNHFMENAEHMQDVSLTIYMPRESMLNSRRILSLLHGVESLMVTTESSILASYKGMEYEVLPMSRTQMENELTGLFIGAFLNRTGIFNESHISPYGESNPISFYGISAILLITALGAVMLFQLYDQSIRKVETLICVTSRERMLWAVKKLLLMAVLFAIPLLLMTILLRILAFSGLFEFTLSVGVVLALLLNALTMAAILQIYLNYARESGRGLFYLLLMILMYLMSGVLGSSYYLPFGFRQIASFLPPALWQGLILQLSEGEPIGITLAGTLIYMVITVVIAVVGYTKSLNRN